MMKIVNLILVAGGLMVACSVPKENDSSETDETFSPVEERNPHLEGFDLAGSDSKAIELADQVMEAMGGRENWNNTRFISWQFFGSRKHLWDKWTGDVRIESLKSDFKVIMNIRSMDGQVWKDGEFLVEPDSVSEYLERGKSMWINDSYWLVMPFKLKDSGVTLKYERADTTAIGQESEVLSLTFNGIGRTPENRYEVWMDAKSKLVTQWSYYKNAEDEVPRFVRPWGGYSKYGNILLSTERGKADLSEINVHDEIPAGVFESFEVSLP